MLNKVSKPVLALLVWTICIQAHGQVEKFQISGTVREAQSKEPLPSAHIFLSNTTIGTVSDKNGEFILDNIPAGKHELIITMIGFETVSLPLNTKNLNNYYNIDLKEKIVQLGELTVTYNKKREYNYQVFLANFLGKTRNARDAKISNPENIRFSYDADTQILEAEALEPINLVNPRLGYRIKYYLELFKLDMRNNRSYLLGRPYFQELDPENMNSRKIKENRAKAYLGSFQHFIDCLIGDSLQHAGYIVRREKRMKNKMLVGKKPVKVDSFFMRLDSDTFALQFKNFLNITYTKEREDNYYLRWRYGLSWKKKKPGPQTSSILLDGNRVLIDESGYIAEPLKIITAGYWSYEKLADLMPLNYKIEPSDNSSQAVQD